MRCVVVAMARFVRNEGRPAAVVANYQRFWQRYLMVFDEVVVTGLVFDHEDPNARPVEGPGVTMAAIPGFRDPLSALRRLPTALRRLEGVYGEDTAFILRCPNLLSDLMYRKLRRRGHPYGLELAGDPYLTFGPEGNRHPLQPLLRWHFMRSARLGCRNACAVAYCSREQRERYPPGPETFETYFSYLTLGDEDIVQSPRSFEGGGPVAMVAVGSLQRLYKSPDLVIEALAELKARGVDATVTWVGGGRYLPQMQRLAQQRGVADRVRFLGQIPAGGPVREQLDAADLYLMPSRAEGLPKALMEAMARGLPCIGSAVGGIPELLAAEDLVPPGDARALADKVAEVTSDPARMNRMAARNLATAREYRNEVTDRRRVAFYSHVRDCTRQWRTKGPGAR